jgi:hypothetical protein
MASEIDAIEGQLQLYFDGLYDGDITKIESVFHEAASLFSVTPDGKLNELPRAQWVEWMKTRKSAKEQGLERKDWIVSIDRSGPNTAFAKVHCQIPPRYFTDYLTFTKLSEGWRIVSKTFHTDTR